MMTVMKAGHPYETEELDDLRAAQRRVLRSIPTWITERFELEVDEHRVADADRPQAELMLRRYVADQLSNSDQSLLDRWQAHTEAELLDQAARAFAAAWEMPLAEDARGRLREHRIGEVAKEEGKLIRQLIPVLVLADMLSVDDYMDPRFERSD